MDIDIWLAFVAASFALVIIPGPTTFTVISYSISQGRRSTVPLILAVTAGDSTALVLSLLGLGVLVAASAFLFTTFKFIGGVYLIYLGIKLIRSRASQSLTTQASAQETKWSLFYKTYLVTALNPKGIMFFVAFLPQFVDTSQNIHSQLFVLACTFIAIAGINATAFTIFANTARRACISKRIQNSFNYVGGSFLTLSGIWTLLLKRPE